MYIIIIIINTNNHNVELDCWCDKGNINFEYLSSMFIFCKGVIYTKLVKRFAKNFFLILPDHILFSSFILITFKLIIHNKTAIKNFNNIS